MAEASPKCLESDAFDIRVTLLAIALDGKSCFAIVTGATRFSLFHITHGIMLAVGAWHKQLVMAICTGIGQIQMQFVAEYGLTRQFNISHLMALDTVTFYREGGFAFMAGATAFATFHKDHAKMGIVPVCPEKRIVTIATGVHSQMFSMAEGQGAEIRNINGDIPYWMASGTVAKLNRVDIVLAMACAA